MTVASDFKHPPTPPAIPGNFAPLTGTLPVQARTPFDAHSMSIGAVSVAALLEDAA